MDLANGRRQRRLGNPASEEIAVRPELLSLSLLPTTNLRVRTVPSKSGAGYLVREIHAAQDVLEAWLGAQ
jgi:hypothetical protein